MEATIPFQRVPSPWSGPYRVSFGESFEIISLPETWSQTLLPELGFILCTAQDTGWRLGDGMGRREGEVRKDRPSWLHMAPRSQYLLPSALPLPPQELPGDG